MVRRAWYASDCVVAALQAEAVSQDWCCGYSFLTPRAFLLFVPQTPTAAPRL